MRLYCENLPAETAASVQAFWGSWNEVHRLDNQGYIGVAWQNYLQHRLILQQHGHAWAAKLTLHNLVLNLLNFIQNTDRMRAS